MVKDNDFNDRLLFLVCFCSAVLTLHSFETFTLIRQFDVLFLMLSAVLSIRRLRLEDEQSSLLIAFASIFTDKVHFIARTKLVPRTNRAFIVQSDCFTLIHHFASIVPTFPIYKTLTSNIDNHSITFYG